MFYLWYHMAAGSFGFLKTPSSEPLLEGWRDRLALRLQDKRLTAHLFVYFVQQLQLPNFALADQSHPL